MASGSISIGRATGATLSSCIQSINNLSVVECLPPLGQFISWCRDGDYRAAGLPDENAVHGLIMCYSARFGLYISTQALLWQEKNHE
ncbi:replication protein P [Pantoea sp. MBLJ3]|uniref:replication protein P n=1 Tax=Pantoea TaxID=53335 RepID=UPI000907BDEE